MDHLAVARGHAVADGVGRLRDDDLMALARGRARHRQPDHAGADHQDLHAGMSRWYRLGFHGTATNTMICTRMA